MAAQKQDDQLERTFSSYVRIQVVVLKTYLGRWTIGRSGERGSGISVLLARYDDDDDGGFQFDHMIDCQSPLSKSTLRIGDKFVGLAKPDQSFVDYMLHSFAEAAS